MRLQETALMYLLLQETPHRDLQLLPQIAHPLVPAGAVVTRMDIRTETARLQRVVELSSHGRKKNLAPIRPRPVPILPVRELPLSLQLRRRLTATSAVPAGAAAERTASKQEPAPLLPAAPPLAGWKKNPAPIIPDQLQAGH